MKVEDRADHSQRGLFWFRFEVLSKVEEKFRPRS
jgi:hypothetical protein